MGERKRLGSVVPTANEGPGSAEFLPRIATNRERKANTRRMREWEASGDAAKEEVRTGGRKHKLGHVKRSRNPLSDGAKRGLRSRCTTVREM